MSNKTNYNDVSTDDMQAFMPISAIRQVARTMNLLSAKGNVPSEIKYVEGRSAVMDYLAETCPGSDVLADVEQALNTPQKAPMLINDLPLPVHEEGELAGDFDNDGIVDGAEVAYANDEAEEDMLDAAEQAAIMAELLEDDDDFEF